MDKAKRLKLIRKISRKLNRERIRRYHKNLAIIRKAEEGDDHSMIHWSDASSYAKEHYGEIAKETTRFDGEWN